MSRTPTILCVDDEAHILHVVSLKLRNAGYHVITANDGEEALQSAIDHRPDLLITDYQMPFLSGLELCLELKKHAETSSLPALMLTARGFALPREQLDRTNIVAVLAKPFSPRDVLARVQEIVGHCSTALPGGAPKP